MLEDFLSVDYEHELGIKMHVAWGCVDTGGHFTQQVYGFCRGREGRGIYAIKGSNTHGKPIINRSRKMKQKGIELLILGTDTAKALIYHRLTIEKPGPEFMHFPQDPAFGYDEEYFKQLTAEKAIIKKRGGIAVREWMKIRERNEALDNRVYALAAFYTHRPKLEDYQKLILGLSEQAKADKNPKEKPEVTRPKPNRPPGHGGRRPGKWLNGWRH
jgi:phage terminase large subunit GpA-like protein